MRSLGLCVHGSPGTGKSWLGATAPSYRVVFDCEGGSRFAPGRKIYWDPRTEPPPEPGDWDTCIVSCLDFNTLMKGYEWLNSGQHPFRSVVVDSLTELQKRAIDQISGIDQPTQQDWGAILRVMEDIVRKIRDLLYHPTRPLECVVLIALTHHKDDKYRAFVKGALELTLPGFIDVVGYLYNEVGEGGIIERKMLIAPLGEFDAKDRTNALTVKYGAVITNPDLGEMIDVIDAATS